MSETTAPDEMTPHRTTILSVLIRLYAREGQVEAALRELRTIIEPIRANPDCFEFRVFQDKETPRKFTLVEQWTNMEAVLAHGQRDYMADYMATKSTVFESIEGEFVTELEAPEWLLW
jgi:quinol monooxygenase YgiN